jgi:hypothetical protein
MAENQNENNDVVKKPPYKLYVIILAIGLWSISKGIWGLIGALEVQKNNQETVIKNTMMVNDLIEKIDIVLQSDILYSKNYRAFHIRDESKVCASCHLRPNMYLLKSKLPLTDFIKYVRGTERHIKNNEMPHFTKDDIADSTLENMWLILKQE